MFTLICVPKFALSVLRCLTTFLSNEISYAIFVVYLQPFLSVIDDSERKNLENGNLKCKSLIKFFDKLTSYYFSLSCNNVDITFTSLVSKNLRFF